jgi:hypothetical protein
MPPFALSVQMSFGFAMFFHRWFFMTYSRCTTIDSSTITQDLPVGVQDTDFLRPSASSRGQTMRASSAAMSRLQQCCQKSVLAYNIGFQRGKRQSMGSRAAESAGWLSQNYLSSKPLVWSVHLHQYSRLGWGSGGSWPGRCSVLKADWGVIGWSFVETFFKNGSSRRSGRGKASWWRILRRFCSATTWPDEGKAKWFWNCHFQNQGGMCYHQNLTGSEVGRDWRWAWRIYMEGIRESAFICKVWASWPVYL